MSWFCAEFDSNGKNEIHMQVPATYCTILVILHVI